ncbi:hypothetical protein LY78DRAFT_455470 [Colletotrichum sublineola]|nr:hypothetical protein LY78DRAFT_455470 [Colletotrichum sublineola]
MPQIVHYTRGASRDDSSIPGKYAGGTFGKGVYQEIKDTYRFICDNYNPGDEIILIGFSRGAFTARSVGPCTILANTRARIASKSPGTKSRLIKKSDRQQGCWRAKLSSVSSSVCSVTQGSRFSTTLVAELVTSLPSRP